jgi:hypothetical protein
VGLRAARTWGWSGGLFRVAMKRAPDRVSGGVGRRIGSALLVPLPASLDRDPATGALSERAADGTVCPYRS